MKRRDLELLSAYLDGELKPSDSTRLEARLKTDPELASVLNDLHATRTLLRQLPARKAPRNFTLTRKMVGLNPPLPRTYPIFRFATAVATLLFFFSFAANAVAPQFSQLANFGRGGGNGSEEVQSFAAEAPAEEPAAAPALEAPPPAAPAPAEPAATALVEVAPTASLAPQGTEIPSVADTTRIMETPVAKEAEGESAITQNQASDLNETMKTSEAPKPSPLVSSAWQIGLAVVAIVCALLMGVMRSLSARRWK